MAIKSTSVTMTTTPILIVGAGLQGTSAAVINTTFCSDGEVVQVTLMNTGGNVIYLQGSVTALGAAPALFSLSTNQANVTSVLTLTFNNPSDSLFAGTTVAGGTLLVIGTRQQGT